jgi:N-methylhydantoinase A/oxoprolinase/acetone carboxylase beta subunit
MSICLGVDTGGTYTDAVLVENDARVLASAKALTTRDDLALGIGEAVSKVLEASQVPPGRIGLAALSTTLATNALVEGQGGRVALIYIGFRREDLGRHGVADALAGDPCLVCAGGHDHAGNEAAALDREAIAAFCAEHGASVSAFAIASHFATRNSAHEQAAALLVQNLTARPVSASHHLSSKLNGPKRALTAVLNARLIGLTHRLIARSASELRRQGIVAPLMVVRGDGALISAEQARLRPIETILSGPAASLVGARWLSGFDTALVSDVGGTTTDVALLRDGRPSIDPLGAKVGPYRTMVEAVAMRTTGLGGDSAISLEPVGLQTRVRLGPARHLPVSLLAREAPEIVHASLDAQMRRTTPHENDGYFVKRLTGEEPAGLGMRDLEVLERIGGSVRALAEVVRARLDMTALDRLVRRGLVQIAGPTPSDACHVAGLAMHWDRDAAQGCLALLSRRRDPKGVPLAPDAEAMAARIIEAMTAQTVTAVLEAVLSEEPFDTAEPPLDLARHPFLQRGLAGHRGLLKLDASLDVPLVALGASAAIYYPSVAERLRAELTVPGHADVANAIGAVVSQVVFRCTGSVTCPSSGVYRVHGADEHAPRDFDDRTAALAFLEDRLRARAGHEAGESGATDLRFSVATEERTATVEDQTVLVEAVMTVEASGRPRLAHDALSDAS